MKYEENSEEKEKETFISHSSSPLRHYLGEILPNNNQIAKQWLFVELFVKM